MWKDLLLNYFLNLECPRIPDNYKCMNPYKNEETMLIVKQFLQSYYSDNNLRTVLFGINPGRFGSGLTGISFTDPLRLKSALNIDHSLDLRPELSSEFVYEVIDAYGSPNDFFGSFFLSAAFPLGFTKNGKNINYYEFDDWMKVMYLPLRTEFKKHLEWPINRKVALCIGQGENYKILSSLNDELKMFERIIPLPHPRWVMQYKRKNKLDFVQLYLNTLNESLLLT